MRGALVGLLLVVFVVFGSMAVLANLDIKPPQQKVSVSVPDTSLPR